MSFLSGFAVENYYKMLENFNKKLYPFNVSVPRQIDKTKKQIDLYRIKPITKMYGMPIMGAYSENPDEVIIGSLTIY